jgi:hypothetical protein
VHSQCPFVNSGIKIRIAKISRHFFAEKKGGKKLKKRKNDLDEEKMY